MTDVTQGHFVNGQFSKTVHQIGPLSASYLAHFAMYTFKALIANLLAAKGLTRLRAGLRAHI